MAVRARAADGECEHLKDAPASDLIGIPGANPFHDYFFLPGVGCTAEGVDRNTIVCASRGRIVDDRMIAGRRRLLMVKSASKKKMKRDFVFVFGCVGGRVQSVLHDLFWAGAKIESASLDQIVIKGSDQPHPTQGPDRMVFHWNDQVQSYAFSPSTSGPPAPGPELNCKDLATLEVNKLLGLTGDWFTQANGCYSEDPHNPSRCDWEVKLAGDSMLGDSRRMIVIDESHVTGVGVWGEVHVFSCVNGRIGIVFEDRFRSGVSVEQASPESITLSVPDWGPHDCEACVSRTKRLTYGWSAGLQSYTLKSIHIAAAPR